MGRWVVFVLSILLIGVALASFVLAENGSANNTCTDSDGGKNYYVKGSTTEGGDAIAVDNCVNSTALLENYCDGNLSKFEQYTCPNGCTNGACVNQTLGGNNTCTEDDDCGTGKECEDGKCVLEDDDDNETEDDCEWQCTKWSECLNNSQARTCTNVNNCTGDSPKQSKTCKEGKSEKVCCRSTETEFDEDDNETKIKVEYEWEDRTSCLEEDEDEEGEVKEIVNNSLCKEGIKESQRIKFEDKTGQTCLDGCFCRGVVMTCDFEGGRQMTIYASSGNIIIQIKGINMTTNVTLYKVNNTIIGNFTIGERPIILPDEVEVKIKDKVKSRLERTKDIVLNEDGFYEIEGRKKARLFWIFSVREYVRAEVDAENGDVKVRNPWWGFLANDREED